MIIAPSLLSADFLHLGQAIEMLNRSKADWIHIDVMDGVFVPNISFGFPVMKALMPEVQKPLDVHLMIADPSIYIEAFAAAGAQHLTIHYEASTHLHRSVAQIKQLGMKAGVSINPHTPVSVLEEILPDLDLVLLMSVNPGFGGQHFIPRSLDKVRKLKALIQSSPSQAQIIVDGGVNLENVACLYHAGADGVVAGSAIFHSADPEQTIAQFKAKADTHVA